MVFKNNCIFHNNFCKLKLIFKKLTELCLSYRKDEKLLLNDQNLSQSLSNLFIGLEKKVFKICSDLLES